MLKLTKLKKFSIIGITLDTTRYKEYQTMARTKELTPFKTKKYEFSPRPVGPDGKLPKYIFDPTVLGLLSKAAGVGSKGGFEKQVEFVETPNAEPISHESLVEQVECAYQGYQAVLASLGGDYEAATPETFASELAEELDTDLVEHLLAVQEADPTTGFTLVATPNVEVTRDDVLKVATDFENGQPYGTYVVGELYPQYTGKQLAGTNPKNGKAVKFSVITNNFTPNMGETVEEHQEALAQLQADNPDVNLEVPAVLVALTLWHTLRAQGNDLTGADASDLTTITHFDLEPQEYKRNDCYPVTRVRKRGVATLSYGFEAGKSRVRLAFS